jgi:adenylate kinase
MHVSSGDLLREHRASETVRRRLAVYHAISEPLVEHYEARGILRRVDGSGDPSAVWDEIQTMLAPLSD